MDSTRFAGPVIRLLRLQKNWSQETLCHGICAVSYLSKIEQGRVTANERLLQDLFSRLGTVWRDSKEVTKLRDDLYEAIFSWDEQYTRQKMAVLEEYWDQWTVGPCYGDFVVIRAYRERKPEAVPKELEPLLDGRQRALYAISMDRHEEAYRWYPCPLTAFCVAEDAYHKGNYTGALEYFQIVYDQASREGYAHLMMFAQHYMANCYSDMGNLDAMYRHSQVTARLARALGDTSLVRTVAYNIAATKAEFGDYQGAYDYFSSLEDGGVLELHKLAVCCEALGKREEAFAALDRADRASDGVILGKEMCSLVRYRLEHPDYLSDPVYGELLLRTFQDIRQQLNSGFARFHLGWVTQWLAANRQYRGAFEILKNFHNIEP